MVEELTYYDKFIGPIDADAGVLAKQHFESLGMTTRVLSSPEASELAKLTETTYFGVLVAWAQEVERYCEAVGVDYDEVVAIYEQIGYLPPVKFFPGVIGGSLRHAEHRDPEGDRGHAAPGDRAMVERTEDRSGGIDGDGVVPLSGYVGPPRQRCVRLLTG